APSAPVIHFAWKKPSLAEGAHHLKLDERLRRGSSRSLCWGFMSSFGREVQNPPVIESTFFLRDTKLFSRPTQGRVTDTRGQGSGLILFCRLRSFRQLIGKKLLSLIQPHGNLAIRLTEDIVCGQAAFLTPGDARHLAVRFEVIDQRLRSFGEVVF